MALWELEGKRPTLGKGTFVFPTADVIGDVVIGENCYIGPGARIRGDYGSIRIGNGTAVEENVVIHARPGDRTVIGNDVTIGHGAIIHNATIEDRAVIGMGAIVSDWAKVGVWAVVAEGALVKNRQDIPSGRIAVGIPAKEIGDVNDKYKEEWMNFKTIYQQLARERYPATLKRLD
jgi:carbonic anhydrase/acetyltransferase-like protein (isoleucine patch superfamily)